MRNIISQWLLAFILSVFSVSVISVVSVNANTDSSDSSNCDASLSPQRQAGDASLEGMSIDEIDQQIKEEFGDIFKGVSLRGFLDSQLDLTPEKILLGMQALINPSWGLRIYPVRSVEDARKDSFLKLNRGLSDEEIKALGDSHFISPPDMPVYILVEGDPDSYEKLYLEQKDDKDLPHKVFHDLAATSEVFYFDLEGQRHVLTPEQLSRLDSVTYNENNRKDHFFYQKGRFAPQYIGVESIAGFMTSSTDPNKPSRTYVEMLKKLITYYKRGLRITFNRDMDNLLKLAGTQARAGSNNIVDEKDDAELGRYDKNVRNRYLALQATGNAYSVEVWDGDPNDPNTRLLGGIFGKISGTVVTVDSMAYIAMEKVRNYDQNMQPLFIVGEGLLLTHDKALAKGGELKAQHLKDNISLKKEAYYTPQASFVWVDPRKDQTNSMGEIEYQLGENGKIKVTPRSEFADFANLALYLELKRMGINFTDVGMVSNKSHDVWGAFYVSLEEAISLFREQDQMLRANTEIFVFDFPNSDQFYKPVGLSDEEFAKIINKNN